jgi:hypothetical protein
MGHHLGGRVDYGTVSLIIQAFIIPGVLWVVLKVQNAATSAGTLLSTSKLSSSGGVDQDGSSWIYCKRRQMVRSNLCERGEGLIARIRATRLLSFATVFSGRIFGVMLHFVALGSNEPIRQALLKLLVELAVARTPSFAVTNSLPIPEVVTVVPKVLQLRVQIGVIVDGSWCPRTGGLSWIQQLAIVREHSRHVLDLCEQASGVSFAK